MTSLCAMNKMINPRKFSGCVNKMRQFFLQRNYVEVHTQNMRSDNMRHVKILRRYLLTNTQVLTGLYLRRTNVA